jgi:hypothetical protein
MFIDDFSLLGRIAWTNGRVPPNGKAKDQYLGIKQPLPTPNRGDGMESATTTDISDSTESHGNERHDVAALVAGRCLHGAKNSRICERYSL